MWLLATCLPSLCLHYIFCKIIPTALTFDKDLKDFQRGPAVKMPPPPSNIKGMGSIPGWGTKIPHAEWCGKKKKKLLRMMPSIIVSLSRQLSPDTIIEGSPVLFLLRKYAFMSTAVN